MQYRKPKKRIVIPTRVAARAATKCVQGPEGCWISTYSTASHGYAQIGWGDEGCNRVVTAHRAAWTYYNGQILEGMTIDHRPTCDRRCVNPAHLRMIPNYENARRTKGRDWQLGQCANGHPNTMLVRGTDRTNRNGTRLRCRGCAELFQARRMWKARHGDKPMPEGLLLSTERVT